MKTTTIKRVEYGRKDTPKELREYRLLGGSPVGYLDDWRNYAFEVGSELLEVIDNDCNFKELLV